MMEPNLSMTADHLHIEMQKGDLPGLPLEADQNLKLVQKAVHIPLSKSVSINISEQNTSTSYALTSTN